MKNKGVALVEIVVSMIILAVAALAVSATVSMINSKQMRSAGGSSLDLQAVSYARETLENLKNAVSTKTGTGEKGALLLDTSYTAPCAAAVGVACGNGTSYTPDWGTYVNGLPVGISLTTQVSGTSTQTYKVWDISSGTHTLGTDVAYKKVTVTVTWTDPV